jgi:hypothetical protein
VLDKLRLPVVLLASKMVASQRYFFALVEEQTGDKV